MKIKSWLKYLIYITLIFILIVLREYVEKLFSESYYRYENPAMFCYAVISLLLGVCIGLFLGLEHLISELRKEGPWKINLPKLILAGLLSLYCSLFNIWVLSGSQFMREIIAYPLLYLFRYGSGYVSLFQMILGYVVITSFFKYSDKN
jgi:MFS superfamily sulfate permease-like transporter